MSAGRKPRGEKRWLSVTLPDGTVTRKETCHSYTAVLAVELPEAKTENKRRWGVAQWASDPKRLLPVKKLLEEQWLGARKIQIVNVVQEERMGSTAITVKQLEALGRLAAAPRSPFDFGSTTVNHLRALGLCESVATMRDGQRSTKLHITEEGRARLQKGR